jgi:hypothetical protein
MLALLPSSSQPSKGRRPCDSCGSSTRRRSNCDQKGKLCVASLQ